MLGVTDRKFKFGDFVLVAKGTSLNSPIMWHVMLSRYFEACTTVDANHQSYTLPSSSGHRAREEVYARILTRYQVLKGNK